MYLHAHEAIIFYDYVSTLPREVEFMWGRKLSSVTLLFYANRWATLVWAVCVLLQSNLSNLEFETSMLQRLSVCTSGSVDIVP